MDIKDILIQQQLQLGASLLKQTVKNEQSKKKMRRICLEIFRTLKAAFSDDPDFA